MVCDEHHVLIETVRWCIYVSQSLIYLRSYATLTEEEACENNFFYLGNPVTSNFAPCCLMFAKITRLIFFVLSFMLVTTNELPHSHSLV